jgi:hypothetical protein
MKKSKKRRRRNIWRKKEHKQEKAESGRGRSGGKEVRTVSRRRRRPCITRGIRGEGRREMRIRRVRI